jgi:aminoglycoside phosphotransferase (APT) family kinase protein
MTLVHADLSARHLLFERGRLTGVIDWGGAHFGDPARDLSIAYSFLPAAARETFFAAYGPAGDETRRLARFRAVAHEITVARRALATDDDALYDEARRGLLNASGV